LGQSTQPYTFLQAGSHQQLPSSGLLTSLARPRYIFRIHKYCIFCTGWTGGSFCA
jgi:hypothetical protein